MRHTRHAFRALRQSGVSSLVTATILALGIGANSAIFSIVNGWLFRPLPVEQPKQLVVLASQRAGAADLGGLSYPDFLDYRSQAAAFQDALAYSMGFAGLRTYARTERILVNYVSANYFAMLGVRPAEGRLILPSDGDSPGASDVAVLGYSYWQSRLKADPRVIGASFLLDGHAVTVCGIAAPEFRGLHAFLDVQAYVPLGMLATHPGGKSLWNDRSNRMLSVMARLREGTSLDMANAALAVVAPRLAQDHPEADKGVSVRAFAERLSRPEPSTASVAPMIAITFMALASALLLLTCFNVANVLLIRANARQTSIALRVALGARARDVIAQVLSEGMLLAILGGLGAMAIAEVLCSSLASIGGHLDLAMTFDFRPDWRVFTYAFIMTLLAGLAVSAFPAMRALRADLNAVTREGGAGSAGRSRRKLANIIVAAQVAGCLVLLIGAGLFIRSLNGANRMDLGFNPKSVVNASMDPSQLGYDAARTARFYRELLYAVVGDYNNDGWPDIYVTCFGRNTLYRNNGNGTFTDVTEQSGTGDTRWSTGAAFGDYDGDGWADLFVANYVGLQWQDLPKLLHAPKCPYKGGVMIPCGPQGLPGAGDALFHNNGDGTFTEVSRSAGVSDPDGYYGLGAVWTDVNNDGRPDLYVANDSNPSFLYRNDGNGHFTDVGIEAGAALTGNGVAQASMGIALGDYLHTGRVSLFVTNLEDEYNILYRNDGPFLFSDATESARLRLPRNPYVGWGTGFFDFDNDGWLDLFYVNGHLSPNVESIGNGTSYRQPAFLYRNRGNGTFENVSDRVGPAIKTPLVSRGCAFGDLFNRGKIDVVIETLDGSPMLLLNDGGAPNNWITLHLEGTKSNRLALGARVTVFAGGMQQTDEVRSGGGYLSQNDLRVHFGLGKAERVDRVEIRWPSTYVQEFRGLAVNRFYSVTEGAAAILGSPVSANSLRS